MLLRFLLVAGVSTWSVFHSVPVGAAEKSKSHPQRLANRPAGNAGKNFYIGLDYNPTFNGVKNLKIIEEVEGARGLFPLSKNASDTSEFNSYHFDWSTPMCGIEFGNSTLAVHHLKKVVVILGYAELVSQKLHGFNWPHC
ncbi:P44/Msp2 family outer membrane protein [Anaplasma ovis]|uniref:P44/Msp2 family outer membrane protein n=1 Tax=Anaplasma ovis TaxID=142058 RepID=UPI000E3D25AD|nr:P44/Msp2 family outer membrane protein [Anaplasma ovis]